MIIGVTRGAGGPALGKHLADTKNQNEKTIITGNRKLFTDNIEEQIKELGILSKPSNSKKPIYHVFANPSIEYTTEQWTTLWEKFEEEFQLENQPFVEVTHKKHNREHKHRVYSLYVPMTGKTLNPNNDYIRGEKIARIMELETGEKLTAGKHTKSIIKHSPDLTEALASISQIKPGPTISPNERMQQERTGIKKDDIGKLVLDAWEKSDNGQALNQAIQSKGLLLRDGDKAILVIDQSGNVHSLVRLLNLASKETGKKFKKADIDNKIGNYKLEQHTKGELPDATITTEEPTKANSGPDDLQGSKGSQDELSANLGNLRENDREARTEPRETNGYHNRPVEADSSLSVEVREKVGQAVFEVALSQRNTGLQYLQQIANEIKKQGKSLFDKAIELLNQKEKMANYYLNKKPFTDEQLKVDILIKEMIKQPMASFQYKADELKKLIEKKEAVKKNFTLLDKVSIIIGVKISKIKAYNNLSMEVMKSEKELQQAENSLNSTMVRVNYEAKEIIKKRFEKVKEWEISPEITQAKRLLEILDDIKEKLRENPRVIKTILENPDKAIDILTKRITISPNRQTYSQPANNQGYLRPRL